MAIAKGASGGGSAALALRVVAFLMGLFFIFNSLEKLPWFVDSGILRDRLDGWMASAHPASEWYIENIARPGVPLFARVVPVAEFAAGAALVAGFWTRLAALMALFMVANFHLARGLLVSPAILSDGVGLPVLGALIALGIAGARLPLSLSK